MLEEIVKQVSFVLVERGGAFGILSLAEAYVILQLWKWGRDLVATNQKLNDDRLQDLKDATSTRLQDAREMVVVLERNNKVHADAAGAMERRTAALDLHTSVLEKVSIRLDVISQLLGAKQSP